MALVGWLEQRCCHVPSNSSTALRWPLCSSLCLKPVTFLLLSPRVFQACFLLQKLQLRQGYWACCTIGTCLCYSERWKLLHSQCRVLTWRFITRNFLSNEVLAHLNTKKQKLFLAALACGCNCHTWAQPETPISDVNFLMSSVIIANLIAKQCWQILLCVMVSR